jgi:chromate transport protein ChrA
LFPHAVPCLLGLTVVVVGALNWVQVDRSRIAATIAVGYCIFLFLLHRAFPHYYLLVMAMVVCVNYEELPSSDGGNDSASDRTCSSTMTIQRAH